MRSIAISLLNKMFQGEIAFLKRNSGTKYVEQDSECVEISLNIFLFLGSLHALVLFLAD